MSEALKIPVPFERGLKALMPLPGCRGKRAQETRGKRFTAFVADTVLDEYPQWSKDQLATEVKFRLNAWRKAGIPSEFFRHACLWFAIWYDGWVKEQRKAAARSFFHEPGVRCVLGRAALHRTAHPCILRSRTGRGELTVDSRLV